MNPSSLLQSVEGFGHSPFIRSSGEIWERLQGEKEAVARELLADGPLVHEAVSGPQENEPADEVLRQIEWRNRERLETRLRDLNDAQDRLIDGAYGRCAGCESKIDRKRLLADPATYLCLACQTVADGEQLFRTL